MFFASVGVGDLLGVAVDGVEGESAEVLDDGDGGDELTAMFFGSAGVGGLVVAESEEVRACFTGEATGL